MIIIINYNNYIYKEQNHFSSLKTEAALCASTSWTGIQSVKRRPRRWRTTMVAMMTNPYSSNCES
jgi:hypothetical protein